MITARKIFSPNLRLIRLWKTRRSPEASSQFESVHSPLTSQRSALLFFTGTLD